MEYSFPRYLLAKQSVDDRALNRIVLDAPVVTKDNVATVQANTGTTR